MFVQCEWTSYNVTNSNNSGSLSSHRSDVATTLWTKEIYSLTLTLLKSGTFNIHRKEWIYVLPRTWNSTRIAWYLTFSSVLFKIITWKNTSLLYWKCLASNTGFKLRNEHRSKKSISFISLSISVSYCNVARTDINSFHLKSVQLNVFKSLGWPNCLIFAITS